MRNNSDSGTLSPTEPEIVELFFKKNKTKQQLKRFLGHFTQLFYPGLTQLISLQTCSSSPWFGLFSHRKIQVNVKRIKNASQQIIWECSVRSLARCVWGGFNKSKYRNKVLCEKPENLCYFTVSWKEISLSYIYIAIHSYLVWVICESSGCCSSPQWQKVTEQSRSGRFLIKGGWNK